MELKEALLKLLGLQNFYQQIGKVTAYDESSRTCTVEPRNGDANLTKVRLQAAKGGDTGVLFVPGDQSDVLVGFLDKDEAFILETSKIAKVEIITSGEIWLNGNSLGGLIKIEELKTQIDKNTKILEKIQTAFNQWVTVPNDGGAALKTLSANFVSLQTADLSNIENQKVKHG